MTIKQYQTLAKTIANKIISLNENPHVVRYLRFPGGVTVCLRDPKAYDVAPVTCKSGDSNCALEFDTISNPNNPNYKFRTLKPGSMSVYNSTAHRNVDITEYNFDTAQFADLISLVEQNGWEISR